MLSRTDGFTILELMIVVAIVAILATIAAPSLRDLNRNARITSATNDLMTDLAFARSEAARRGSSVAICTSTDGTACAGSNWSLGRMIFLDPDRDGVLEDEAASNVCTPASACILRFTPAIEGSDAVPADTANTITAAGLPGAGWIGFRPSGIAILAGGAPPEGRFTLCDARTTAAVGGLANNKGRRVTVSQTGRAISQPFTCAENPPSNP